MRIPKNACLRFGNLPTFPKFDKVKKFCHVRDQYCDLREEKQTDVALAVEILSDCYELGIERIVLITSDSDHVPLVTRVRNKFPATTIFLVAPPKRLAVARELGKHCNGIAELTAGRLLQHGLPSEIRDGRSRLIAARPAVYSPHSR